MRNKLLIGSTFVLVLALVGTAWAFSGKLGESPPTDAGAVQSNGTAVVDSESCCVTGDCCCPLAGLCCDPAAKAKAKPGVKATRKGEGCCVTGNCCCPGHGACCAATADAKNCCNAAAKRRCCASEEKPRETRNPRSEIRNPSLWFRISCFGFRICIEHASAK